MVSVGLAPQKELAGSDAGVGSWAADLLSLGALIAITSVTLTVLYVNIGVIILRRTNPVIGAALCVYLMTKLEGVTWLRFGIWLAVGLLIYFACGRAHSRLRGADIRTDTLPETP